MPLNFSGSLRFSEQQSRAFNEWLEKSSLLARDPEFLFSPEPSMAYVEGLPLPFTIIAQKPGTHKNSSISVKVVTERETPENTGENRM